MQPNFYHVKGAIPVNAECYVKRNADTELLDMLRKNRDIGIFSKKKMGKSSLINRCLVLLKQNNILVAKIKFNDIPKNNWCDALIEELVNSALENDFVVDKNWRNYLGKSLDHPEKFICFLKDILLDSTKRNWVIAFDEINDTDFDTDSFFGALRWIKNARVADPVFRRVTFLLSGKKHGQLVKNNRQSPFSIESLTLTKFDATEAKIFLRGLGEVEEVDHPALQRILYWTHGNPYSTHRMFSELAKTSKCSDWKDCVDKLRMKK